MGWMYIIKRYQKYSVAKFFGETYTALANTSKILIETDLVRDTDQRRVSPINCIRYKLCRRTYIMTFTFNGIGTMLYGQRDYGANGSYITTEWYVFFYVPIAPLRSMRILEGAYLNGYTILENTKLSIQQVLSVYGWFAAVLGLSVTMGILESINQSISPYLGIPLFMILPVPWILRRLALNRVKKESERKRMGLPPTTMG